MAKKHKATKLRSIPKPRSLETIQSEYAQLCREMGQREYQKRLLEMEQRDIAEKMVKVNQEAFELKGASDGKSASGT